jgi:small subunit ribosomal protein S4e
MTASMVHVTNHSDHSDPGVNDSIRRREKHKGSFEIVHIKDAAGHEFATRAPNVFAIGEGNKPMISLPKGKGIKLSIVEELEKRKEA